MEHAVGNQHHVDRFPGQSLIKGGRYRRGILEIAADGLPAADAPQLPSRARRDRIGKRTADRAPCADDNGCLVTIPLKHDDMAVPDQEAAQCRFWSGGSHQPPARASAAAMTLVVLASAQILADDVDPWGMPRLRALLPVAGMTVIEQQAERARANGAGRMVLLVDGVPPALAEACDRIRSRGLAVELVRDGRGTARATGPDARLLLVADGLVAGDQAWRVAASARAPAVLVTEDAVVTQELERIDPATRWAGFALIGPQDVAALAEAPDGWDAQLLALRQAVQTDAQRIHWDKALFVSGDIALATATPSARDAEQRLLAGTERGGSGLGQHWLIDPIARLASAPLLSRHRSGRAAHAASLAAALAACGTMLAGWPLPAIALGLASAFAGGIAAFVARFRPEGRVETVLRTMALLTQLFSLLLIERGALWNGALIGTGGGGLAAVSLLLVAISRKLPTGRLPDTVLTWVLLLLAAPVFGVANAAALVTVLLAGITAFLLWREPKL